MPVCVAQLLALGAAKFVRQNLGLLQRLLTLSSKVSTRAGLEQRQAWQNLEHLHRSRAFRQPRGAEELPSARRRRPPFLFDSPATFLFSHAGDLSYGILARHAWILDFREFANIIKYLVLFVLLCACLKFQKLKTS